MRLLAALTAVLLSVPALAEDRQVVVGPQAFVGRYQIVNGTPDQARNIMLLDTITGETWLSCTVEGAFGWCKMKQHVGYSTTR